MKLNPIIPQKDDPIKIFAVGLATLFAIPFAPTATTHKPFRAEKPRAQTCLEQIQEIAPLYGLDTDLVTAVHLHETGNGKYLSAYEPTARKRANRITRDPSLQRELSTSHGCMHVLGLTARQMGLSVGPTQAKKSDPEWTEAGIYYLAKCKERRKTDFDALVCYNGSSKYPPKVFARLRALRKHG